MIPDFFHVSLDANIFERDSELRLQLPALLQIEDADEKFVTRHLDKRLNFLGIFLFGRVGWFMQLICRRKEIDIILLHDPSIAREPWKLPDLIPLVTDGYVFTPSEVYRKHDILQRTHRIRYIESELLRLHNLATRSHGFELVESLDQFDAFGDLLFDIQILIAWCHILRRAHRRLYSWRCGPSRYRPIVLVSPTLISQLIFLTLRPFKIITCRIRNAL